MRGDEVCGLSFFNLLHRAIGVLGMSGLDKILSFLIVYSLTLMKKFWQDQVTAFLPVLDRLTAALQPEWRLPENAPGLYAAAQKKCQNIMCDMLNFTSQVGQAALLRKQIANELSFSCKLDANLLSCALETMDKSLINSIRKHYHDKANNPYPGSDGNPLLTEFSKYLDAAGINDPFCKIYMTSEPLEGLPALLLLVVASYSPNLVYDKNFGSLVRSKPKYPIDGAPMVAGIVTILKQFHPSYTREFLSLMGQYVRAMIDAAFMKETKITELPLEALNMLLVIEMFCKFAHIPRSVIQGFVPSYIFDAINV
jgi:WASH complex subunit strumpellin